MVQPCKRRATLSHAPATLSLAARAAEDILRVVERVSRIRTPAYTRVQKISQLILDEYLEPRGLREITYREVVAETRARALPNLGKNHVYVETARL